ncbi:hypothetical protein [Halomonas mongoliensis]|uniref:hypothetical protein n=1 Tax=Halomonas mongoliensis TaxID=321265 RepID=UPI00403B0E8A
MSFGDFWRKYYVGLIRINGGEKAFFLLASIALSISKFCKTALFFLPIKVLILLSSSSQPYYLKALSLEVSPEELAVSLMASLPLVFFLQFLSGFFYRRWSDKSFFDSSGRRKEKGSRKKNQKLHGHYVRSVSEIFIVFLSLLLITLYSLKLAILFGAMVACAFYIANRNVLHEGFHSRHSFARLGTEQVSEYLCTTMIIISFAVLAIMVLKWNMSIYISLLMMILCRLIFQSLQRFMNGVMHVSRLSGWS